MSGPLRERGVLLLLALAVGAFTLTLDFAQDDFWLLPTAGQQLANIIATPVVGAATQPKPDSPTFQPMLYLWVAALDGVLPRPWSAWPFHAVVVLLHALTVLLLFGVLARRCTNATAFAACALFIVAPMGMQAWTWVSASGAVLALLFTLLAIDTYDRAGTRSGALWRISLWTALALLSQRGALMALPLMLTLVWQGSGSRWRRVGVVAALPLLGLMLQGAVTGFGYIGGTRVGIDALPQCIAALPTLLLDVFAFRCDVAEATAAWSAALPRAVLLLPWVLLLLAGLAGNARVMLRASVPLLLALAPALIHWSMLAEAGLTSTASRSLYLPVAALCALVAVALQHSGRWRRMAICGLVLAIALAADGLLARSKDERAAATLVRSMRARTAVLAAQLPADAPLFIADAAPTYAALPLISASFQPDAAQPPFGARSITVLHFSDAAGLFDHPRLRTEPGPLGLLDFTSGRAALLHALPRGITPAWRRVSENVWEPALPTPTQMPGRMLAAVRLRPAPGAAITGIAIEADGAEFVAYACDVGGEESITLGFADNAALLCAQQVTRMRVQGALDLPPVSLAQLPLLADAAATQPDGAIIAGTLLPVDGATFLAGTMPEFSFSPWPRAAGAVLELRFKSGDFAFAMHYSFAHDAIAPADTGGRAVLRPTQQHCTQHGHPDFSFETAAQLFAQQLRPFGLTRLDFQWRITATAPNSPSPMARSAWHAAALIER